jgi:predicted Zn-ribbon and HTH transcriptional regulator
MSLNTEELNSYTYERRKLRPVRKTFPTLSYPQYDKTATPRKCPNCGMRYFGLDKPILCHYCKGARV